jgi:hypothetical protein
MWRFLGRKLWQLIVGKPDLLRHSRSRALRELLAKGD